MFEDSVVHDTLKAIFYILTFKGNILYIDNFSLYIANCLLLLLPKCIFSSICAIKSTIIC
jgi:hypothetical protein